MVAFLFICKINHELLAAHSTFINLVDSNNTVLNTYQYDVFGNANISEETINNRFMYRGEQFDKIDNTIIQLIPTKLHKSVPHIGSASDLRGGF
ncbi:MAG: HNH endonuclease [Tepidibacter sp.]|uniref:hypothetical protein n=1 Tax=Tepidibacter sp. TaxID=2529387 RepID=UPI0025E896E0|nr:hypothetical protein [Tepidibacter sp.]MCT4509895.1 HNH endonuclease [Tepidibacter sp.]